jgi:peptidase E
MSMVCLQGGNELTPDCRPMDERLLREHAGDGPVVVVPLASKPGADYARTSDNAVRYFTSLGATALAAPDARRHAEEAARVVRSAGYLVLTGGSPRTLRDALMDTGLGAVITERFNDGVAVMGSSAGAMVACETALLPQWRGKPSTGPGLGLVHRLVVVPHFDGKRSTWVRAALAVGDVSVVGIPECSGVVVEVGAAGEPTSLTALGVSPTTVIDRSGEHVLVAGVGFEPT